MYIPAYASETRPEVLHALIRGNPLAMLVSVQDGKPFVSHLPLLLENEGAELVGHLAAANPHVPIMRAQPEILCVFRGEQGYISPRWYSTDEYQVPTWNYAVAHARGQVEMLDEEAAKTATLERLIRSQETRLDGAPWNYVSDPREHSALLKGIVAFRIRIEALDGKFKLGQNREDVDRQGAIDGLSEQPAETARELASAMQRAWRDRGGPRD